MNDEGVRGLIIAGASSHCGKTLVTSGLIGSLRSNGLTVAAAKCGPDYIDPKFLEAASGRPVINLDPWAMSANQLRALAAAHPPPPTLWLCRRCGAQRRRSMLSTLPRSS